MSDICLSDIFFAESGLSVVSNRSSFFKPGKNAGGFPEFEDE